MPLNKVDLALYQEMLAEQKARQAHATKIMIAATTRGALPDKWYNWPAPKILPEPEFSLEELDAAQKIIDDCQRTK